MLTSTRELEPLFLFTELYYCCCCYCIILPACRYCCVIHRKSWLNNITSVTVLWYGSLSLGSINSLRQTLIKFTLILDVINYYNSWWLECGILINGVKSWSLTMELCRNVWGHQLGSTFNSEACPAPQVRLTPANARHSFSFVRSFRSVCPTSWRRSTCCRTGYWGRLPSSWSRAGEPDTLIPTLDCQTSTKVYETFQPWV